MIYDMPGWQRELVRVASRLRRHAAQHRWQDASDASVERSFMLGFYTVRKILDAFQPPPSMPQTLTVTSFPRKSTRLSAVVWPDVEQAFDLSRPTAEPLPLRDFCNQVIHSHFFSSWIGPDKRLRGVFCSSDRLKNKKVYRVEIGIATGVLERIGASRHRYVSLAHFYPDHNWVVM